MTDLMADLRPRSNSEILDAAFEIYRRFFVVFIAINVFASIPVAAASYIAQNALALHQSDGLMTSGAIRIFGAFITPFTEGAMVFAASAAYLGTPVDLETAARKAFARPGRLFFAMFAKWVLFGFGLVLFVVPGLVVFKRYFAIPMTVLFEDNNIGNAISRSRHLSSGNGSRIFILIGGVFLFTFVFTMFLSQAVSSLSGSAGAVAVMTLVITTAIPPFSTIVATLLYYDIRIRKEGYDIELMSRALDTSLPDPLADVIAFSI
jgi:hypothetical protein